MTMSRNDGWVQIAGLDEADQITSAFEGRNGER
jgi:hypothetical protein